MVRGGPPPLPGLAQHWSRRVVVPSDGQDPPVSWHLLDNAADVEGPVHGTLLAVHGNPTWSYLWRSLLPAGARGGWRVVAVDQLGMGWSQRDGRMRRLADRVTELGRLTDVLDLPGPVVTVGHDWGGVVSLGWAVDHRDQLGGVVLTNTAVHHDDASAIPSLLRLAGNPAVHGWATRGTRTFLRSTLALARPSLPAEVRAGYLAPYPTAAERDAIADFVADIPAAPEHPSYQTLARIAGEISDLDVPALVLWGPHDPVFQRRYLEDLLARLPQADVHRFTHAGHLLPEDADVATTITHWLTATPASSAALERSGGARRRGARAGHQMLEADEAETGSDGFRGVTQVLDELRDSDRPAVLALREADVSSISWHDLARQVEQLAAGLQDAGVRSGQRVSLLVPPGVELTTALFACLRLGAVVVLADQGLGLRGMSRAIAGAGPDVIIGIDRALGAARALAWPGIRIAAGPPTSLRAGLLDVATTVPQLQARGQQLLEAGDARLEQPEPDADAAILFTSGSTGPAKGVVYTHRRLAAMRDALAATYTLGADTPFVAGFAPFALLGTALGALAVTPDMDVSAPSTLTATALARAVAVGEATTVFTSPAALRNVLDTVAELDEAGRAALGRVTLFLSAGAPIAPELLAEAGELMSAASLHTPYGMTEMLPVTDIDQRSIEQARQDTGTAGAGGGTCVGGPVVGAAVRIVPLDEEGGATGSPTEEAGVVGEILVSGPHLKDRYDRLWATQAASADHPGWHRTGDVGHLDAAGRLWVEGRLSHVLRTAAGVLTPVALEHAAETIPGVRRAAAVGVGPAGSEQVIVVVETDRAVDPDAKRSSSLATPGLTRRVRLVLGERCGVAVAAVLRVPELPTDVRHNAKIERTRLARWAEHALAGGRMGRP